MTSAKSCEIWVVWMATFATIALNGCAHRPQARGAPATGVRSTIVRDDSTPAPSRPSTRAAAKAAPRAATPSRSLRSQAIADTAAAGRALRRCKARRILPGDEVILESTQDLLRQARLAFTQGNVELAASYARSAKQLSSSLSCP